MNQDEKKLKEKIDLETCKSYTTNIEGAFIPNIQKAMDKARALAVEKGWVLQTTNQYYVISKMGHHWVAILRIEGEVFTGMAKVNGA